MMKRWMAVFCCCGLLLAACGGGGGPTAGDQETDGELLVVGDRVLVVARALDARLGTTEAVIAVLYASERGYAGDVIVTAAGDGRLNPDGTIVTASGDFVTPSGAREGIVILPEDGIDEESLDELDGEVVGEVSLIGFRATAPSRAPFDESDLQDLVTGAAERMVLSQSVVDEEGNEVGDEAVLVVILGLASTGYSVQQIVDFLVLGGVGAFTAKQVAERPGSVGCIIIATPRADGELKPLRPARGLNPNCAFDESEATPTPAEGAQSSGTSSADPVAGTYFGTASVKLTFPGNETFESTECTAMPDVELVLGTDNSAVLTVVWTNYVATPPQPPGEGCEILDSAYDVATVGTWEGDRVEITVRTPRRGIEAEIAATIDDGEISVMDASLVWAERTESGIMNVDLERVER